MKDHEIIKFFPALGTVNSITLYDCNGKQLSEKIKNDILKLHDRWNIFDKESEISMLNKNAGEHFVKISHDTYKVISEAISYSHETDNTYNIFAGDLFRLWKNTLKTGQLPEQRLITEMLLSIDSPEDCISMNPVTRTAYIKKPRLSIDLGGIAKGYALKKVRDTLVKEQIRDAVINLGGTVCVLGKSRQIGIRNPFNCSLPPAIYLEIDNKCIVTSGIYEQFFIKGSRCYHHIIDPRTGYPSNSRLVSVTLIGENAPMLDAFATSALILGTEKALPILERNNIDAVFISDTGRIMTTKKLIGSFTISNTTYKGGINHE